MNEIVALLRSAIEEGSENILTPQDVKNWLAGYLRMHDDEIARFPTERNCPHWDLLAADYDSSRNAVFLLAFFQGESVLFLVGRGGASAVRDFGENGFSRNPDDVLDDVSRRFWIAGRTVVDRAELRRWLGSDDSVCE